MADQILSLTKINNRLQKHSWTGVANADTDQNWSPVNVNFRAIRDLYFVLKATGTDPDGVGTLRVEASLDDTNWIEAGGYFPVNSVRTPAGSLVDTVLITAITPNILAASGCFIRPVWNNISTALAVHDGFNRFSQLRVSWDGDPVVTDSLAFTSLDLFVDFMEA